MKLFSAMLVMLSCMSAFAASEIKLQKCNENGIGIESLIPGVGNQKSVYNGNVTLYAYDIIEPAAASQGIAIVYTVPEEFPEGFVVRECAAITYLSGVDLKNAKSTYDAKTGVTLKIPVRNYDNETGGTTPGMVELNIKSVNTGTISEGHVLKATKLK